MVTQPWTLWVPGTKLPKCPQKARLFEAICRLFKPLTDIYNECPALQSHMKKVRNWKDMQWLCVAYIQQDPNKPKYVAPAPGVQVGSARKSNSPTQPTVHASPKAPCSTRAVMQPLSSSGLEAPNSAPHEENVLGTCITWRCGSGVLRYY